MEQQESGVSIGLQKKKLAIMVSLGQMHKDSMNKEQKFMYLSDDALISAVQAALIAQKIVLMPPEVMDTTTNQYQTKSGTTMNLAVVKVKLGILDTESGESEFGICVGSGADMSDKAVYKALTGARKYFFRLLFAVGTGDDPDKDSPEQAGRQAGPPPARQVNRNDPVRRPEPRRDPLDDMIDRAFVDMGVPFPERHGVFNRMAQKYGSNKEKVANVLADMAAAGEKWGCAALIDDPAPGAYSGYEEGG